jgi:orotate phosphoribosyltransferase
MWVILYLFSIIVSLSRFLHAVIEVFPNTEVIMPLTLEANSCSRGDSDSLRSKVFNLILKKSFSKGEYTLASGRVSNFYLDMKPSMFSPEGADALSSMIFERLQELRVDYIGGLELGAVPLISTTTMLSYHRGKPLPGFFVRKEVKGHGTKKLIEGLSGEDTLQGKRVVILDDVTTSGGSAMNAVNAARALGAVVILVLSVVDREEGASEFYKNKDIPFDSLFKASEFMAA